MHRGIWKRANSYLEPKRKNLHLIGRKEISLSPKRGVRKFIAFEKENPSSYVRFDVNWKINDWNKENKIADFYKVRWVGEGSRRFIKDLAAKIYWWEKLWNIWIYVILCQILDNQDLFRVIETLYRSEKFKENMIRRQLSLFLIYVILHQSILDLQMNESTKLLMA